VLHKPGSTLDAKQVNHYVTDGEIGFGTLAGS